MIYRDLDVLEVWNNAREAVAETFSRYGELIDEETGPRVFDDHATVAVPVRSFVWTCFTRAECVALRTFLQARQGRRIPFWVPTYCWDMQLAVDYPLPVNQITVKNSGYSQFLAGTPLRRFIAIFRKGDAAEYREIIGVSEGVGTEIIEIDGDPLADLSAVSTRICYLVLCRLEEDEVTINWSRRDVCEAQIEFRELPREYPAFSGGGMGAMTPVSNNPQHYIG
jgi:hypothetical protein